MANYATLKAAVQAVVKTNGNKEITGANLQTVLLSVINSVGGGYLFKGVATPSTDAGTPDENVFYIGAAGTYANFGTSITIPVGSIGVFKYNGSWVNELVDIAVELNEQINGIPEFDTDFIISVTQSTGINNRNNAPYLDYPLKQGETYHITVTGAYATEVTFYPRDASSGSISCTWVSDNGGTTVTGSSRSFVPNGYGYKITPSADVPRWGVYINANDATGTGDITVNFYKAAVEGIESKVSTMEVSKEDVANKVTSFQTPPTDTNYPSEKLVYDKLFVPVNDVVEKVYAKNVYNYSEVGVINGLISAGSGSITTEYNGFTTGLIPVEPSHYYYLSNRQYGYSIRCLSADGTTKSKVLIASTGSEYSNYYLPNADGSDYTKNGQFKTSANAAYVQISISDTNVTALGDLYKIMLEDVGSSYNADFVPSAWDDGVDTYKIKNESLVEPVYPSRGQKLRVLLIGSSHGVNTISMFPVLAKKAGINIMCGNLYSGSATIGLYTTRPAVQIPYMAKNNVSFQRFAIYEDDEWETLETKTMKFALQNYEWDVIILQRGASENTTWDDEKANYFQYLLDYIKDNTTNTPVIYFNSGLADAAKEANRASQITQTENIMETAQMMRSQFGIEIIPTAIAVQYARATCLKNTGQWEFNDMACDTQHLDTGVGQYVTGCTMFEKIVKDLYGYSIMELGYLPVYADVSGNVVNEGSTYFTAITDYYSRIGKIVAALAVNDNEYKSATATELSTKFGSLPTTYTITNNLTGCSNDNSATSITSDSVYLSRLFADSGKTFQSVSVTMGGVDITATSYVATYSSGGTTYNYNGIRIGEIAGNIVITATAS